MKMEETHHTYTNHDFKKGTLKELQNEETNPNHQPSAPPIVPKQNLQFFDKLQQQAPSNLIGGQQANKKIKTRSQGGKVVSYSNVKRPKKEGPPKETGVQKEANPNDPGEPGVMNLRETVGGYEEMTEETKLSPSLGLRPSGRRRISTSSWIRPLANKDERSLGEYPTSIGSFCPSL